MLYYLEQLVLVYSKIKIVALWQVTVILFKKEITITCHNGTKIPYEDFDKDHVLLIHFNVVWFTKYHNNHYETVDPRSPDVTMKLCGTNNHVEGSHSYLNKI